MRRILGGRVQSRLGWVAVTGAASVLLACSSGSGAGAGADSGARTAKDASGADSSFDAPTSALDGAALDTGGANRADSAADAAVGADTGPGLGDGGADAAPDAAATDAAVDATAADAPAACSAGDGGVPLDCAAVPSACCFPDSTNTGVPAGTSLTASGSLSIQTDGTVISGLDVTGTVDIYANNVTIKSSRVAVSSSGSYAVAIRPGMTGTVIQDSVIRGQDNSANSVEYAVFNISGNPVVLDRVDLYNCSECIMGGGIQLTDSYLHDMADPAGAHVEGTYGLANSVYTHNTIFNSYGQTAAIYLDPNLGGTLDCQCTVTDNLLAGGGYTIYGGSSTSMTATNVVIQNNRFSRLYYPMGGYWGIDAYFSASGAGNAWTGNIWDDTGLPVGP